MSRNTSNEDVGNQPTDPVTYNPANTLEWGVNENIFGNPYTTDLTPVEVTGGREVLDAGSDGEVYCGADIRRLFENKARQPTTPIWIGQGFSPKGLRSKDAGYTSDKWFIHQYIGGSTGSGKSTNLVNQLTQVAYSGWGFCFVDPSGDTIREVIARLPEYRLDDVVYIAPPTGDFDKTVAFNLLEVERFDGEPQEQFDARISKVVEQNVGVIGGNQEMFARMEGILEALMQAMIEADEPYTPLSIQEYLTNEDMQTAFTNHIEDAALRDYHEIISGLEQNEIEPLIRRLNKWVLNKTARKVVSHPESSIDLSKAVEDGKIILVDTRTDAVSENVSKAIGSLVTSRVWATCIGRGANTRGKEERRPFFFYADELNDCLTEFAPIPHMLENARKYRLSINLASQEPGQLPGDWPQAVLSQCNTFVVGKIEDDSSKEAIANKFDGVDPEDLAQMPKFQSLMQIDKGEGVAAACRVKNFAPYPELRDDEAVTEVIEDSLDKYGTGVRSGLTYDNTVLKQVVRGDGVIDTGTNDVDQEEFLKAVDAVELFTGCTRENEYVSLRHVSEELRARTNGEHDLSERQLGKAVVQLPESLIQSDTRDGDTVVSLTDKGRQQVRDMLTGDSGSAGDAKHQLLVQEARHLFTRLRCSVEVPDPTRVEGEPADAVAPLPAPEPEKAPLSKLDVPDAVKQKTADELGNDDMRVIMNAREQYRENFTDALREYHDLLPVISGGRDMNIEVESSTSTKPALTLRNFKKAVNNDKHCVFVVRSNTVKNKVVRTLNDPAFVKRRDGERVELYTGVNELQVSDATPGEPVPEEDEWMTALREKDGQRTKWVRTGETTSSGERVYRLERTNGDVVARVSESELENERVRRGVFTYHGGKDPESGIYKVMRVRDGTVESHRLFETKAEFTKAFAPVTIPFMPHARFNTGTGANTSDANGDGDDGELPDVDDWSIIVIPEEGDDRFEQPTVIRYERTLGDGEETEETYPILFDGYGVTTGDEHRESELDDASTSDTGANPDVDADETDEDSVGTVETDFALPPELLDENKEIENNTNTDTDNDTDEDENTVGESTGDRESDGSGDGLFGDVSIDGAEHDDEPKEDTSDTTPHTSNPDTTGTAPENNDNENTANENGNSDEEDEEIEETGEEEEGTVSDPVTDDDDWLF